MLTSLSFVFLLGLAMAALCQRIKIPRIIGMLLTGILLGPCVLNWLSDSVLGISSELRQMALIIILLKAGLSLNLADLDVNMFSAVDNSLINDGCGLFRGRLILPYEHLSRFQNDVID